MATKFYFSRMVYAVANNAAITTGARLVFYYGGAPATCGYTGTVAVGRQFSAAVRPESSVNGGYTTTSTSVVTLASSITSFTAAETFQTVAINTATNAGAMAFITHSAGVRIGPASTYIPKIVTFTSA